MLDVRRGGGVTMVAPMHVARHDNPGWSTQEGPGLVGPGMVICDPDSMWSELVVLKRCICFAAHLYLAGSSSQMAGQEIKYPTCLEPACDCPLRESA